MLAALRIHTHHVKRYNKEGRYDRRKRPEDAAEHVRVPENWISKVSVLLDLLSGVVICCELQDLARCQSRCKDDGSCKKRLDAVFPLNLTHNLEDRC